MQLRVNNCTAFESLQMDNRVCMYIPVLTGDSMAILLLLNLLKYIRNFSPIIKN